MNNFKKSGLRPPNRVTVKKLANDQKARVASSSVAIANKCKVNRQNARSYAIDKRRGIDSCNDAEHEPKEIDVGHSERSINSPAKDKKIVFKEKFEEYLRKKDEKVAAERNYFNKHPPFYVGGKNVNDSEKKSKIPMFKSFPTPNSKLPLKLNFNNAKVTAKFASSAVKHAESKNADGQQQTCSVVHEQQAPVAVSYALPTSAPNDENLVEYRQERTQASKHLKNTFSIQDCNTSKSDTVDSNPNDVEVLQKTFSRNASPEKIVETTVNMKINDTPVKIPTESPNVFTTNFTAKNIVEMNSSQNNDLNVQVQFENVLEVRRSNRKTRYTGSFTAMAAASDGKRRSRSIGGKTSVTLTTKYSGNVHGTIVTENLSYERNENCPISDESKENCPPSPQSPVASSSVTSPLISGSLNNCASLFSDSTPNCSYAPSTGKRRKTMTPFELNVDLVKAPEINFNDSFTSPLKAPNSILKSSKRSTVGHKTVHFELSASSSISFDPEILDEEETESGLLAGSSPPSIVSTKKEERVDQMEESLISPFLRTRRSIYPARENLIDF